MPKVKAKKVKKAKKPAEEPKEEPKLEPVPEKLAPQQNDNVEEEPRLEPPAPAVPAVPEVDPDYLRQYQFKKVNGNPKVGGIETDPDKDSKANAMKKNLLSQQKVGIFIPRAEKEDSSVKLSVNLNGYRLDLPKNVYIDVPRQIAEVVTESLNQQASALLPFQIGRDKATEEALS